MDPVEQYEKPLPPEPSCSLVAELRELVLWRDWRKSGVLFVSGLVVLVSMLYFSLISVLAYLTLSLMAVTFGFRAYSFLMTLLNRNTSDHPFQDLLSLDVCVEMTCAERLLECGVRQWNRLAPRLRALLLIADLFDSAKFTALLYLTTYIGAWFNTMTLIILGYLLAFTVPKLYEQNQQKIDHVLAQCSAKLQLLSSKGKVAAKSDSGNKKDD